VPTTNNPVPTPEFSIVEDFKDPSKGRWLTQNNVSYAVTYNSDYNGSFYEAILKTEATVLLYHKDAGLFSNIAVQVDGAVESAQAPEAWGTYFQKTGSGATLSYYVVLISSDGKYLVGKGSATKISAIVPWTPSSLIKTGLNVTNQLLVQCLDGVLDIYVNGQYLWSSKNNTFEGGEVGLIASTLGQPNGSFRYYRYCYGVLK
jgi:hypothetical protein